MSIATDLAAAAAGSAAASAWFRLRPQNKLAAAQTDALVVDSLRDALLELRAELRQVRKRLREADELIEKLTGERLPAEPAD